jgi:hypothetical protein
LSLITSAFSGGAVIQAIAERFAVGCTAALRGCIGNELLRSQDLFHMLDDAGLYGSSSGEGGFGMWRHYAAWEENSCTAETRLN